MFLNLKNESYNMFQNKGTYFWSDWKYIYCICSFNVCVTDTLGNNFGKVMTLDTKRRAFSPESLLEGGAAELPPWLLTDSNIKMHINLFLVRCVGSGLETNIPCI